MWCGRRCAATVASSRWPHDRCSADERRAVEQAEVVEQEQPVAAEREVVGLARERAVVGLDRLAPAPEERELLADALVDACEVRVHRSRALEVR